MSASRSNRHYDRQLLLEAAAQARARGRRKRAIRLYRWVLAVEPNNAELHARLAPLLAEDGQTFDAWQSFRATAQAALREGRVDKALAIHREACQLLPREIEAWQSLSRVLAKCGEEEAAVEALVEGSRKLRTASLRPGAIHLLRGARLLSAWNVEAVLALARLLRLSAQREEARMLLEGLAERADDRTLRRVRRAELSLDPGPASLWRFVTAGFRRRPDAAPAPRRARPTSPTPRGVVTLASRRVRH